MRFRHGMLLMVTAAVLVLAVIGGTALALLGGTGTKSPRAGRQPMADSSESRPSSAAPDDPSLAPRVSSKRPKTSSSTMVGSSVPRPSTRPSAGPTSPAGPPNWWATRDPRYRGEYPRRHRNSAPPWWRHR
ncbi:MAG: hypothetical protein JWP48_6490 [Actinoallomurus sp.]|jgi:cytoskeletal protein RodZ|nr:hypothetical protein [Actinoallomurus sp.]